MKRLLPLAAVEVFVWGILLLSTFLISKVVFSINLGNETLVSRIATETLRVVFSGAIILVWLIVWKKIADNYFRRTIARREATA